MSVSQESLKPWAAATHLDDGGEMGQLIREMDWSRTSLGSPDGWSKSLRTILGVLLTSRHPMFLWWGPELIQFYNDGYRPSLGADRHPAALGARGREFWVEIWPAIGPQIEAVMTQGESTWHEDHFVPIIRNGYLTEVYWTYSYSPVRDDDGAVGGTLVVVQETTKRVIGERRLRSLRDLSERSLTEAKTTEQACRAAATTLVENPRDFPFALIYLLDEDGQRARLCETVNLDAGTKASPTAVKLNSADDVWHFQRAFETNQSLIVENLEERFERLPAGPWTDDSTKRALVLPLAKAGALESPAGFLVAGISPRLALDNDYRSFLELAAGHIATAIANARAYEQERQRAEALSELDRAKTAFFSNVSHEFRTPLTLLLGPLEDILAHSNDLPAQDREHLEMAHRNSLRLLKLVNTLLDFSRLEAGRLEAVYEPTDLSALTAELASVFRSAIEKAGMKLIVDCPPLDEPVWVDREMWEKIVLNLLSNAFKFTFAGEIEVSLKYVVPASGGSVGCRDIPAEAGTTNSVELTVRDTGTGIPAAEMSHVFERFHRVKDARGRSDEGSGIGLALVQELVNLHGGTVRVEGEIDRGSTFVVSLPRRQAHQPVEHIGAERTPALADLRGEAYVQEALRWLPDEAMAEVSSPGSRKVVKAEIPAKAGGTSARILLADDNADLREYVQRLLSQNYEVVAVADGAAALQAARTESFNLVLADVMMPQMDGFELLHKLRADERLRTIPIILLSARAGEEARVKGLEEGADDYLVKPFSARELRAHVEAHLQLQRVRREAEARVRESEIRFRQMADQAPVMVWVTEPDATCTYLSKSWYEFTGQTPETGLGFGWIEAAHPDDREQAGQIFLAANARREAFKLEYRLLRKDGKYRWAIDSAVPRLGPEGEFLGYIGSVIDITERKQMEEALREADRRKDEFLAMLAHELRNPLAPIRNAAQVLKLADPIDADQQQWARAVIERQTQHLTRLVDDLLDVSRITQGKVTLQREPLELSTIISRAVEASRPLTAERRHDLRVTLPPEPIRVSGDLTRLVQVVGNLLNNAAKYSDEGSHIWLEAQQEGNEVVLRVRDEGIGLSDDLRPHIFDLFTQADRSLDRAQGGLGIGLTLVRNLVELHGGKVEAKSEGPSRGSEFIVRLPAHAPAPVPNAAQESCGEPLGNSSPALRVLVVEDNFDSAEMLALMLELNHHEVRVTHDGPSALAVMQEFQPQVVLCDIGLPGMNGYEVAQELRARSEFKKTRLIALSGYGRDEDRHRSRESGFDSHLMKPVEPDVLEALLSSVRAGFEG